MTIRWTEAELAAARARLAGGEVKPEPAQTAASAAARASAQRERSSEAPDIEGALVVELQRAGLAGYVRNHRFDPRRRLELDFAWVSAKVAVEVQGGIYSRGAHVRPAGYKRDAEKARRAQLMGWMVFPCTAEDVRTRAIVADVETALELRRPR